jgi:hypothetical protein
LPLPNITARRATAPHANNCAASKKSITSICSYASPPFQPQALADPSNGGWYVPSIRTSDDPDRGGGGQLPVEQAPQEVMESRRAVLLVVGYVLGYQ